MVNGYAVYGEGTDHIHIVNNFIGKCRSAGYYAKTVAFRIAWKRGGTSRDTKNWNNIFYDCKEAAVKFPTEHNESEGNLYLNMPGGYLRILYPAPAACLDLQAWQEFYGLDLEGQEGRLEVAIDTEKYTLEIRKAKEQKGFPGRHAGKGSYLENLSDICKVKARFITGSDFFGNTEEEDTCLPGPFGKLTENRVISIDPRRL